MIKNFIKRKQYATNLPSYTEGAVRNTHLQNNSMELKKKRNCYEKKNICPFFMFPLLFQLPGYEWALLKN